MNIDNQEVLKGLAIKHRKAKSQNGKNIIFGQMEPLFREQIKKYLRITYRQWHNQTDHDDLYQICLIAIENTIKDYDPKKGEYGAWLYIVISRKVASEMKRLASKKYKSLKSIDSTDPDECCLSKVITKTEKPILTTMANQEDVKALLDELLTKLSPSEAAIFKHYQLNEYKDYIQIAKDAGVKARNKTKRLKTVDNALVRIRNKAQAILKEKGSPDFLIEKE